MFTLFLTRNIKEIAIFLLLVPVLFANIQKTFVF